MRTNSFTLKMSKKSNQELENIIEEKYKYTDEAIQAVVWELENRGIIEKTEVIEEKITKEVSDIEVVLEKNESPFNGFELPELYSKTAIRGFTLFFSTIFGTALLMYNLKERNKPKARIEVLVFGIFYTILSCFILNYLPANFFFTLLFNFIGYTILAEYFWNKHLGKDLKHEKKTITKPLVISLLITAILVFIILLPVIFESNF